MSELEKFKLELEDWLHKYGEMTLCEVEKLDKGFFEKLLSGLAKCCESEDGVAFLVKRFKLNL